MKVTRTSLPEVLLLEPTAFHDARGVFFEMYRDERYAAEGVGMTFVQDNVSRSEANVLRGMHLQHPHGQAKLISVVRGAVFDVAVDVRVGSPTFGRWVGHTLSDENHHQLFVPVGFAHGFAVTNAPAIVVYKCSTHHRPSDEVTIRWNDEDLGIDWPLESPVLAPRDETAPRLREVPLDRLPTFGPRESSDDQEQRLGPSASFGTGKR